MADRIFTKHVHLLRDAEIISFAPGDTIPEWADRLVTNPDVFENTTATPKPAEAVTGDGLDDLKADELRKVAGDLGLPTAGNKTVLKDAIRAHRDAPEAPEEGRAALEARAAAQGIEFDDNTTDIELEVLLEG